MPARLGHILSEAQTGEARRRRTKVLEALPLQNDVSEKHGIPRRRWPLSRARRARNFGHGTNVISDVTGITVWFETSADDESVDKGFHLYSGTHG